MDRLSKNLKSTKRIYIIGAGGHGQVVADIAKQNGYTEILFIDDRCDTIKNYRIVGSTSDIDEIYQKDSESDFFVAIGNNQIREQFYNLLKSKNIKMPVLIHPTAVIDSTVTIKEGTVIMANVVINANAIIGNGSIINTAATVDHDCILGDFVHISPGVHVAGTVHIGNKTWIGIGSSIINNINICSDVTIGAGTTVINDINNSGTYVGMPLRKLSYRI